MKNLESKAGALPGSRKILLPGSGTRSLFAAPIHWLSETTSTNSLVVEIAKCENLDTLVLATDHQTQGRGQFGRMWLSQPTENLLFSIYFKPVLRPFQMTPITKLACDAVVEVLMQYNISCSIKLPNDILVYGKKICGILTESCSHGETLEHVVVGIGLNVNSTRASLIPEATSLYLETQKTYDRTDVLDKILHAFETLLNSQCWENFSTSKN